MKDISILILIFLLGACTHLDNYMLGKDNTPLPSELKPVKSQLALQKKWSVVLPAGKNSYSKLHPTVIGNIIYIAESNGVIEAVEKTEGRLLWSKKLPYGIVSGPSVASGYVALATDSARIVLLKQIDGREIWTAKVSSEVLSKPLIIQNKVIAKTIDGNLYAFDVASGKKLWVSEHGAPSLILKASSSPVVIQNKLVLVGYSDGRMDAVDLQTGQLLWQRSIAFANGGSDVERLVDIDADPIVQGKVVYLASYQGYVGALSLVDGQFIWRKRASVYKNIALDSHALYLTDSEDIIWSFNKENGQVNWKQTALKARGLTEPVLMNNRLIIGDKMGFIHILSKNDGNIVSREKLNGPIINAPSVANKNIYVMTNNGTLNNFSIG